MSKDSFTKKQADFCRLVVENGGDKIKAYQDAGYSQNMDIPKQGIQADKIYNLPKLRLRIQQLQAKANEIAEEKFSISIDERLRRLDHIYHCGVEEKLTAQGTKEYQNLSVAQKTIETMNSMLGDGEGDEVGDSLNITFNVADEVKEVRVTRGT